jgi:hypothetical protein
VKHEDGDIVFIGLLGWRGKGKSYGRNKRSSGIIEGANQMT